MHKYVFKPLTRTAGVLCALHLTRFFIGQSLQATAVSQQASKAFSMDEFPR